MADVKWHSDSLRDSEERGEGSSDTSGVSRDRFGISPTSSVSLILLTSSDSRSESDDLGPCLDPHRGSGYMFLRYRPPTSYNAPLIWPREQL